MRPINLDNLNIKVALICELGPEDLENDFFPNFEGLLENNIILKEELPTRLLRTLNIIKIFVYRFGHWKCFRLRPDLMSVSEESLKTIPFVLDEKDMTSFQSDMIAAQF